MKNDGIHFFNCLHTLFTKGVADYASDTTRRSAFVEENAHLFAGTMLVAVFAYLESTLGRTWIQRCGGRQRRELECLRVVRNAFTHTNSHFRDLESYTPEDEQRLREFVADLEQGRIEDDRGNQYPPYISVSSEGVIRLTPDAANIFRAIGVALCH